MQKYKFTIEGTTGDGNTYTTSGVVEEGGADIIRACHAAMHDCFQQLTSGRAVFGNPGVGCRGPYQVTRFVLEIAKQ